MRDRGIVAWIVVGFFRQEQLREGFLDAIQS